MCKEARETVRETLKPEWGLLVDALLPVLCIVGWNDAAIHLLPCRSCLGCAACCLAEALHLEPGGALAPAQ